MRINRRDHIIFQRPRIDGEGLAYLIGVVALAGDLHRCGASIGVALVGNGVVICCQRLFAVRDCYSRLDCVAGVGLIGDRCNHVGCQHLRADGEIPHILAEHQCIVACLEGAFICQSQIALCNGIGAGIFTGFSAQCANKVHSFAVDCTSVRIGQCRIRCAVNLVLISCRRNGDGSRRNGEGNLRLTGVAICARRHTHLEVIAADLLGRSGQRSVLAILEPFVRKFAVVALCGGCSIVGHRRAVIGLAAVGESGNGNAVRVDVYRRVDLDSYVVGGILAICTAVVCDCVICHRRELVRTGCQCVGGIGALGSTGNDRFFAVCIHGVPLVAFQRASGVIRAPVCVQGCRFTGSEHVFAAGNSQFDLGVFVVMRFHFLDLECLCFGVIHQTVVLRLVAARRRIVAEGKAAPKLLRHAGDGVLKFVVDGRLACAKHNLGIRAQLGGVYRAALAIQAEAAGDVYRALQRNLCISILQIQRTIGIIFIRIRLIIGECAVLDDVLAGAKLHGAAKVVRRRYRHMVQTCGVVIAGVLDLAHINATGHSQIFQHQTIGRIILIPAIATIAKIDASINGAWMFGAVGDGQFLPSEVRAIERAPSISGSKLQCQIVTIQAQVALPIHRKAMVTVISFLDRPCNILGQIQVIGGNGICLDAILCGNILRQRLIELRSLRVAVLRRGILFNACGAFAACPGVALRHGEVLLLRICPHRVRKVQADSLKTERDGRSAAEAVTQCDLVVVRRGKHCPEHCALFDLGILQFAVQLQCAAGAVRYIGIFRAGIRHQRPAVQVCLATGQLEEVSGVLALVAVVLQRQRAPIHIRRAAADREHIGIRSKAAAFQVHRAAADRKIGRAVAEIQIIIRRRAAAVAHIQTDTVGNSQRFDIQRTGIIDRRTIVSARARLYACAFNGGRSGLTHAHQMGIAAMSLYGNISQRRIGGIRHADATNRVKRYLIQLHLCVSIAADCVAQAGVPRQGGKGDIGEARCSIVEFKATPADCEVTAGYGDCSRRIRSRCAVRAHQHTESFVLLHPGAAGDVQRAAVHADQR